MRVALCQIPVSSQPSVNLIRIESALTNASEQGSELAIFPEGSMVRFSADLRAAAQPLDGPFCAGLAQAAKRSGVALIAGVFEPAHDNLVYNTTVAFDASGELVTAYRKIHLFDALGELVVAEIAGLKVGILTCYDVRFPELARALTVIGADLIAIPSAWASGLFKEEHWVTLVRARAIENTIWVAAAGQVPDPDESPTRAPTGVGRSLLVDPMGTTRLDLGSAPGVGVGLVDTELTERTRSVLPCLRHRRPELFAPVLSTS
jgi:predicted amidohydrolase